MTFIMPEDEESDSGFTLLIQEVIGEGIHRRPANSVCNKMKALWILGHFFNHPLHLHEKAITEFFTALGIIIQKSIS